MPDDIAYRRKKLLVADMELTIIEQECLDELADYVGLRPKIAGITERAMRGELDFETAIKERVGLLKGLDARVLDQVYVQRVTVMPGAQTLVATMHANGAYCALVSGGFRFFTQKGRGQARLRHRPGQPPGPRRRQNSRHRGRADPRPRGQARRPQAACG